LCVHVRAQTPARGSGPSFEVASVKPNTSAEAGASFGLRPGGQIEVRNNTLRNMVRNAYQLQNFQIVGGPDWFDRDRFDITAKAPDPNATPQQLLQMVQSLLADRFKLVVRRETREVAVYALTVARADGRLGPKLERSTTDCAAIVDAARRGAPPPEPRADGRPLCGTRASPGRVIAGGVTMSDLARNISNAAGRLVVDRTALAGAFDLELEFTQEIPPAAAQALPNLPAPPENGASLFTAVQEQLGLKLDPARAPADVVVIDSAARPDPD